MRTYDRIGDGWGEGFFNVARRRSLVTSLSCEEGQLDGQEVTVGPCPLRGWLPLQHRTREPPKAPVHI